MSQFFDICKVDDVPLGEARMFLVNEQRIGVFHLLGNFFAIDDAYPHAGASLSRGVIEGDVVRCRIHHWRFCIHNGKYLDEVQPRYNARSYRVRVVDDQVQVELPPPSLEREHSTQNMKLL